MIQLNHYFTHDTSNYIFKGVFKRNNIACKYHPYAKLLLIHVKRSTYAL